MTDLLAARPAAAHIGMPWEAFRAHISRGTGPAPKRVEVRGSRTFRWYDPVELAAWDDRRPRRPVRPARLDDRVWLEAAIAGGSERSVAAEVGVSKFAVQSALARLGVVNPRGRRS